MAGLSREYAAYKLRFCVRLAREASYASWQELESQRNEYRRIRREAMQDARYWRDKLTA
ncbi:hypothetical protein vBPaeMUSP18_64 [Pseudomonas phage vB_PaeM_USP_18]|nr:hypothetical protein vBPaeMUSP18_64 [Pseudomonas phage vB_PaeM_USP_18]